MSLVLNPLTEVHFDSGVTYDNAPKASKSTMLVLFAIAIVIVVVCGILISYLSVRKRNALTSVLDVLTMFPYIIPGSVLGISFLYAFNGPPFLLGGTADYTIQMSPPPGSTWL